MRKGSDINVGSIEEHIKILENLKSYLNLLVYDGNDKIIYNDLLWDEKTVDCINAIEHLLSDYTRQKQINKEHQKINGELREKVKELEEENLIQRKQIMSIFDRGYIPKQAVIDKIKELDIAILECEYDDDDVEEYKNDVEKEKKDIINKKSALEELLEEK